MASNAIVYDTLEIGRRLKAMQEEQAQARRRAQLKFSMPPGWIILLSADITPPIRLPKDIRIAFLVHMSVRRPMISLAHIYDNALARHVLDQFTQFLRPDFPSVSLSDDHIALSVEDCQRLVERVRAARD